jgi:hypothetical protein
MGIDLDKIRQRKQALESKGGAGNNNFWRPQDGDQSIRIVPTADGDPFKDYFFHYNLGKTPGFLCPKKNFGESCPVCDYANSLYNQGTEDAQDGPEKCAELLDNIPEFDSLFERKTSEEVGTLLDNFLEGGDDEETTEVTQYKKADESSSVDEAFNELLS